MDKSENKPVKKLKKNSQFKNVYQHGESFANHILVIYVLHHPEDSARRMGFSISKKVGNAVQRNHIRRRLIEIYRLHQESFKSGIDIVIIPRYRIINYTYKQMEKGLIKLFKKAGILKKNM